jgi:hypothetical protein
VEVIAYALVFLLGVAVGLFLDRLHVSTWRRTMGNPQQGFKDARKHILGGMRDDQLETLLIAAVQEVADRPALARRFELTDHVAEENA